MERRSNRLGCSHALTAFLSEVASGAGRWLHTRDAMAAGDAPSRSAVKGQWDLPGGGQRDCPAVVNRTARWWPGVLPEGVQVVSGVTPLPPVAWVRRMLSPVVMTTWAWCRSRSTVALAMVLGISSSKPAGWRFEDRAIERFS
jgi:hypothetical protein